MGCHDCGQDLSMWERLRRFTRCGRCRRREQERLDALRRGWCE